MDVVRVVLPVATIYSILISSRMCHTIMTRDVNILKERTYLRDRGTNDESEHERTLACMSAYAWMRLLPRRRA